MNENLQTSLQALKERFNAEILQFRDDVSLVVGPDQIVDVCMALRDELGFEMLVAVSCVDYWPKEDPRFHVIYQFLSLQNNQRIGARVPISGISPSVPTVEGVYPSANWYEREVFDMFGIRFDGHTDLRRIIMPYDWEGYPLRKDYPLGYEEVRFTFNTEDLDLRKPGSQQGTRRGDPYEYKEKKDNA